MIELEDKNEQLNSEHNSLIPFVRIKSNNNQNESNAKMAKKRNLACRICFGGEDESDNPLFSPCKCAGSMKYIHFKCLRDW